jgi:hypothetical protein
VTKIDLDELAQPIIRATAQGYLPALSVTCLETSRGIGAAKTAAPDDWPCDDHGVGLIVDRMGALAPAVRAALTSHRYCQQAEREFHRGVFEAAVIIGSLLMAKQTVITVAQPVEAPLDQRKPSSLRYIPSLGEPPI